MVAYISIGTATSSLVALFFFFSCFVESVSFASYAAVIDSSKAMLRVRFYLMRSPPPGITIAHAVSRGTQLSRPDCIFCT